MSLFKSIDAALCTGSDKKGTLKADSLPFEPRSAPQPVKEKGEWYCDARKPIICKYLLNGNCDRGDSCSFSHVVVTQAFCSCNPSLMWPFRCNLKSFGDPSVVLVAEIGGLSVRSLSRVMGTKVRSEDFLSFTNSEGLLQIVEGDFGLEILCNSGHERCLLDWLELRLGCYFTLREDGVMSTGTMLGAHSQWDPLEQRLHEYFSFWVEDESDEAAAPNTTKKRKKKKRTKSKPKVNENMVDVLGIVDGGIKERVLESLARDASSECCPSRTHSLESEDEQDAFDNWGVKAVSPNVEGILQGQRTIVDPLGERISFPLSAKGGAGSFIECAFGGGVSDVWLNSFDSPSLSQVYLSDDAMRLAGGLKAIQRGVRYGASAGCSVACATSEAASAQMFLSIDPRCLVTHTETELCYQRKDGVKLLDYRIELPDGRALGVSVTRAARPPPGAVYSFDAKSFALELVTRKIENLKISSEYLSEKDDTGRGQGIQGSLLHVWTPDVAMTTLVLNVLAFYSHTRELQCSVLVTQASFPCPPHRSPIFAVD